MIITGNKGHLRDEKHMRWTLFAPTYCLKTVSRPWYTGGGGRQPGLGAWGNKGATIHRAETREEGGMQRVNSEDYQTNSYIQQSTDQFTHLRKLLRGKIYGKDCKEQCLLQPQCR